MISTWMSSRFTIRRFSGRVTPCSAAMTAVCFVRRSTLRKREAAGHRVGVGVVVQEDEDAVGVAEIALVLLDLEAGQGAAELGEQRAAEQLRHRQVVQLGELRLELFFALARVRERRRPARRRACLRRRGSPRAPSSGCVRPLSSTMTQVPGVRSALR